jgi:hypothetical protein
LSLGQGSGWLAQYTLRLNPKEIAHMDPSILLSLDSTVRRARLSEIRQIIDSPVATQLWADIRAAAVRERDLEPYLVDSVFPGRDEYSAQLLGMDYTLCRAVGLRILRHALMFLVDEDQAWLEAALRQAQVLFDDAAYPAWNHRARMTDPEYDVHLRTGMLAKDVGVMLNWLRPHLDVGQLESIVMGLDKRAVRPFQEAIQTDPWWIGVNNNWLTCIVGGLGVCGMALDELHPEARNLIDFADPLMERHLQDFGAAGEFNEGRTLAGSSSTCVFHLAICLHLVMANPAACSKRIGWSPSLPPARMASCRSLLCVIGHPWLIHCNSSVWIPIWNLHQRRGYGLWGGRTTSTEP